MDETGILVLLGAVILAVAILHRWMRLDSEPEPPAPLPWEMEWDDE